MINFRSNLRTLLVPAVALAFAACGDEETTGPDDDGPGTIAQIAQDTDDVSTLVTALESAGLVPPLDSDGPFTVFAPVNSPMNAYCPAILLLLSINGSVYKNSY